MGLRLAKPCAAEEIAMKVIQKGKEDSYEDFYPSEYEFKLCGGSVEPKDCVIHQDEAATASEPTSRKA